MPIHYLDDWAASRALTCTLPLSVLSNTCIGIDAFYYLNQHLDHHGFKEPLLPALGGLPFSLKANIERELRILRDHAVTPTFVFNGLETESGRKESEGANAKIETESARAVESAWDLYVKGDAVQVVEVFSSAGNVKPQHLFKFLQRILEAEAVDYLVAPYAATAQLSYLYNGPKQFIDSIYGPTDAFLLKGVDKVITRLDMLQSSSNAGSDFTPTFTWITRQSCQDELGRLTDEQFTEFCLLLGSPFLGTFPPFEGNFSAASSASISINSAATVTSGTIIPKSTNNATQQAFHRKPGCNSESSISGNGTISGSSSANSFNKACHVVREAIAMFNTASRSALALCAQYEDPTRPVELQYTDLYKRAFMTVRHHVILDIDGHVTALEPETHSNDLHELIGQRLPEELYYYISKGVISGHTVPSWLTNGIIRLELPLGVDDTPAYRELVTKKLAGMRNTAVRLLSSNLHRFYQTKSITVKPWYAAGVKPDENPKKIGSIPGKSGDAVTVVNLKDVPSVRESVSKWKVGTNALTDDLRKLGAEKSRDNLYLFAPALKALEDTTFAAKTICPKDSEPLSTRSEILANSSWRFLQIRGYIDDEHNLTPWGQALSHALSCNPPPDVSARDFEEYVFLGIELVRLDELNGRDILPGTPVGATMSEEDKIYTALISRTATIGKLRHQSIGYSGPLNRQALAFRSQIACVRQVLRDLIEVVLVNLLLNGDANRESQELTESWTSLSLALPFINDNDCALGLAVRTYLETLHLTNYEGPTKEHVRNDVKTKGADWFHYIDSFPGNLETGFRIWDAVYEGVKSAGRQQCVKQEEMKIWDEAGEWLKWRR
ncbi:hypothetical protein KEM54_002386 [Ascosphaera aggregata]|nr:hypothetical protein KEM54_002386 [Ascosphaera aggregata]